MNIAEGLRQDGIQQVAKKMLQDSVDKQTIMKYTGLTEHILSQLENQEPINSNE